MTRFFLAIVTVFLAPLPLNAAPKKAVSKVARRTVLDYFRLLPMETGIFEVENREALLKKDWPHIVDVRNDYLQVTGDGAQRSFQIAVFRHHGRDLVAVSSTDGTDYDFDLWRDENKMWRNVTKSLSPVANRFDLHFVLPRSGTSIKVYKANGSHISNLRWKQGKFHRENLIQTKQP